MLCRYTKRLDKGVTTVGKNEDVEIVRVLARFSYNGRGQRGAVCTCVCDTSGSRSSEIIVKVRNETKVMVCGA